VNTVALLFSVVSQVFSGAITVSGELWRAECLKPAQADGLGCGVPQKLGDAQEITFTWADLQPGAAFSANEQWKWNSANALVEIYAVHPHKDSSLPKHVQVKLSLTRPVEALCTTTVEYKIGQEIPPLVCASTTFDHPRQMWGVTVKAKF
jgi:hypothetical protein